MNVEDARPRKGLLAGAVVLILVAAAFWLPRWLENRTYREQERIAGVDAPVRTGTLADARRQIDPGATTEAMLERLGKPSMSVATEGKDSRREIWTYYFSDGTMLVNVTDGVVQRVSTTFGPPRILTSARPE